METSAGVFSGQQADALLCFRWLPWQQEAGPVGMRVGPQALPHHTFVGPHQHSRRASLFHQLPGEEAQVSWHLAIHRGLTEPINAKPTRLHIKSLSRPHSPAPPLDTAVRHHGHSCKALGSHVHRPTATWNGADTQSGEKAREEQKRGKKTSKKETTPSLKSHVQDEIQPKYLQRV